MARHSARRFLTGGLFEVPWAEICVALAAAGMLCWPVAPAAAQGWGAVPGGSGPRYPGRTVRRPAPEEGDGPAWGIRRLRYPGLIRFPAWVEPQPGYPEEVRGERRRRPPPDMAERRARSVRTPIPPRIVSAPRSRPAPPPAARAAALPEHVAGEIVVEFRRDAPAAVPSGIARQYRLVPLSARPVSLLDTTLHRFRVRGGRPVVPVIRALEGDARVAFAQPNNIFRLQTESLGAMAEAQYARAKLRLPEAHLLSTGEGITVAVIDSAMDTAHPELTGAVTGNLDARGSRSKPDAHGTAIGGIIAARATLSGAAPATRLLAIEAFGTDGKGGPMRGVSTDIVAALSLAAEASVRLVNLSFAGPSDPLVGRAIAAAQQRGAIFVAAAGNGGPKALPSYPAADPNVIAVTATDARDGLFSSANRGSYVSVAAPGVDVLVAAPGKAYRLSSGTSMAAAHVTGVLALVMQKRPDLTLADARRLLTEGAKDLGPSGPDPDFGAGLVDALRTVERALGDGGGSGQLAKTAPAP